MSEGRGTAEGPTPAGGLYPGQLVVRDYRDSRGRPRGRQRERATDL